MTDRFWVLMPGDVLRWQGERWRVVDVQRTPIPGRPPRLKLEKLS